MLLQPELAAINMTVSVEVASIFSAQEEVLHAI